MLPDIGATELLVIAIVALIVVGQRLGGRLLGLLLAFQAVPEGADALGGVAHQAGDLPAAAEQQREKGDDDENLPERRAHWGTPGSGTPARPHAFGS